MSSITATESTTREKRVPSSATSCMIRKITGMLVTATAIPKPSVSAALLPAVPMKLLTPRAATSPSPPRTAGRGRMTQSARPAAPHHAAGAGASRRQRQHEKQQAKLIYGPQRGRRRAGGREDPVLDGRKGCAKGRRPEEYAADYLPDCGGCLNRANSAPAPCAASSRTASAISSRARSTSANDIYPYLVRFRRDGMQIFVFWRGAGCQRASSGSPA